ncbi:MAG: thrombospondin type 3 repeat-containing protein, partial [Bacteroidales bacterium]|nr:thrombospondin type 3 repeat-containing protein [Bacteroidales bacterium]
LISVSFNEPINCMALSADDVTMTMQSTGMELSLTMGCNENRIIIVPDIPAEEISDDTFNIELKNVMDKYGNARGDTIRWAFVIPDKSNLVIEQAEDADEDGLANFEDNCPYAANPGQEDLDTDGSGDVCDPDMDGDEVLNLVDNCVADHNPDQSDLDGDGVGDACEEIAIYTEDFSAAGYQISAFPNPFSDHMIIQYELPYESHLVIRVFDIVGNEIAILKNARYLPGKYEYEWDSYQSQPGLYFIEMKAKSVTSDEYFSKTLKMFLAR